MKTSFSIATRQDSTEGIIFDIMSCIIRLLYQKGCSYHDCSIPNIRNLTDKLAIVH